MPRLIAIAIVLILAALLGCQKPPAEEITLKAAGRGTFEIGYYFRGTWNKSFVQDTFSVTLSPAPGDTLCLAAYSNDWPVIIQIIEPVNIDPYAFLAAKALEDNHCGFSFSFKLSKWNKGWAGFKRS